MPRTAVSTAGTNVGGRPSRTPQSREDVVLDVATPDRRRSDHGSLALRTMVLPSTRPRNGQRPVAPARPRPGRWSWSGPAVDDGRRKTRRRRRHPPHGTTERRRRRHSADASRRPSSPLDALVATSRASTPWPSVAPRRRRVEPQSSWWQIVHTSAPSSVGAWPRRRPPRRRLRG